MMKRQPSDITLKKVSPINVQCARGSSLGRVATSGGYWPYGPMHSLQWIKFETNAN